MLKLAYHTLALMYYRAALGHVGFAHPDSAHLILQISRHQHEQEQVFQS